MTVTDRNFELGELYCERGDFHLAIELLNEAADGFLKAKDYSKYLKTINLLLRIHSEREEFEKVNLIKERLQDLVLKEGFELNSKTYYTLGICAAYKQQFDVALDYFQKSLAIGLASDNKEDMCYAINGLAVIYNMTGRYEDALKELYNLEVFFQVIKLPKIQISSKVLNANVLINLKKFDQALEILWSAYDGLKEYKNMHLTMTILTNIGIVFYELGNLDLAKVYLQMASRALDTNNSIRLSKIIKSYLDKLGNQDKDTYDLVLNLIENSVQEKKLGKIDFKNQFILLDLLKLFVQNQGQVYSKEYLVEHVWKQQYDPTVHDNKIYVTIKRLRKMIEPDYEKPKYIFRAKNGYFMNKSARIHLDSAVNLQ